MKKSCKMKTLIVIMAIIILVSSIPIVAIEDQSVRLYVSERADGKCFLQGENETIKSKSQFDTYIENILIARLGEQYVLTFKKDTEAFEIVVDIVAAKMNNVENDHYLFAPVDFIDETYKILNIKFTTNANEYDLIPANTDLKGKTVLTIIFEDIKTADMYYWQTELFSVTRSAIDLDPNDSNVARENANEFYYITSASEVQSESGDFNSECDAETYEMYETLKNSQIQPRGRTVNNPYWAIGIPDSVFKTVTDEWRWLAVNRCPGTDITLPVRYYAYSYSTPGAPNVIYTHIMMIGHVAEMPEEYETVNVNGERYCRASGMLKMEIYRTPHTVAYYVEDENFDYMQGGENLTKIPEPAIKISKDSTGVPHVLTGRYSFSDATKNNFFGSLVLKKVMIGVLDKVTYGIASELVNLTEMISSASMSVSATDGYVAIEEYSPDVDYQEILYGYAMGSSKSEVNGYLELYEQYFGTRCWFSVPEEYSEHATDLTWTYYVSIAYK